MKIFLIMIPLALVILLGLGLLMGFLAQFPVLYIIAATLILACILYGFVSLTTRVEALEKKLEELSKTDE